MRVEWAGVAFQVLGHRDGGFIRAPGLWAFARREASGGRLLLWVEHSACIAQSAGPSHPRWGDALALGMNELHVCLQAQRRIDGLQLRAHLIRRTEPLLNVLEDAHPAAADLAERSRA